MIPLEEKIINKLLVYIYKDKKDTSIIRIDIDNVVKVLSDSGYILLRSDFEKNLDIVLNKHIVGKLAVGPGTAYTICKAIIELANKLHIDQRKLLDMVLNNNTEEDAVALQKRIDEWRKEYYGSLPRDHKEQLLKSLEGRLRPDVLEKIRRS